MSSRRSRAVPRALFAELIRGGWRDANLEELTGRNLLRVPRATEQVAGRLQKQRPPSNAKVEHLDRPGS